MCITYSLLIVEDDQEYAFQLKDFLAVLDITIHVVHDTESACRIVENSSINFAILDIKLPPYSNASYAVANEGFKICTKIKERHFFAKVAMLTAYENPANIESSFKIYRADDFISKTIDAFSILKQKIEKDIAFSQQHTSSSNPFHKPIHLIHDRSNTLLPSLQAAVSSHDSSRFLILGAPSIGKTCTLSFIQKLFTKPNCSISRIEMRPTSLFDSLHHYFANFLIDLSQGFSSNTDRVIDALLSFFKNVDIEVETGIFQTKFIFKKSSFDKVSQKHFLFLLEDGLKSILNKLPKNTSELVLLFDNLHHLSDQNETVDVFLKCLDKCLSHHPFPQHVICAYTTSASSNFNRVSTTMAQFFKGSIHEIEPFSLDQTRMFISRSLADTNTSFDDTLIEKLHYYTEGHPSPLVTLCSALYSSTPSGPIYFDSFDNAFYNARHEILSYVNLPFESLSQNEKDCLFCFLSLSDEASINNIMMKLLESHTLFPFDIVEDLLRDLCSKGFVKQIGNMYRISSPLVSPLLRLLVFREHVHS